MSQVATLSLVLLVLCLLLSAFFSSSEAAFLSVQKLRIRNLVEQRVAGAKRVARMVEHPERILPTILLGNTLVNTAFAALATVMVVSFLGEGTGVIVATVGATIVLLTLGETAPKTFSIRHSEGMVFFSARIIEWLERLLLPVVIPLQWVSRSMVHLFGGDIRALVTEEELRMLIGIGQAEGMVEKREAEMLQNVFRFGDRQVREVMTPRIDVEWIELGTTLKEFFTVYQDHPHSRFPVFEGHLENVVGILSVKDVVAAMARGSLSETDPVTESLQPVYFTPDIKLVGALFREMQGIGSQMALVVDEFGGIDGLVTLKQLMEQVVGRVGEEGMQPEPGYETIDENTFHIDGDMRIEEANEKLSLGFPQGDYETVAGFILDVLGHIPTEGGYFRHRDLRLVVTQMKGMRIERVMVTRGHPTRGR